MPQSHITDAISISRLDPKNPLYLTSEGYVHISLTIDSAVCYFFVIIHYIVVKIHVMTLIVFIAIQYIYNRMGLNGSSSHETLSKGVCKQQRCRPVFPDYTHLLFYDHELSNKLRLIGM